MTISVSGVLAPFGTPIKNAKIIIESLNTDESLKGSELRYNTSGLGGYSFTMENGLSLVRYIHKDVMNTLGIVNVGESTPTDIDLVQLIREYAIKDVDDLTTSGVEWQTQLETHIASTEKKYDISQASTENALSTDYEEASEGYNSSLGRSVDVTKSKHSKYKDEKYSFSIDGNTVISSEESYDIPNGFVYDNTTISEDADGVTYRATKGFNANGVIVSKDTYSENNTNTLSYKIEGLGLHKIYNTSVSEDNLTESNDIGGLIDGYILNTKEDNVYAQGYLLNNIFVNKPEIKRMITSHISIEENELARQDTGIHVRIDADDQIQTKWTNNLTAYEKTAYDEVSNNGLVSRRNIDVDELDLSGVLSIDKESKIVTIAGKLNIENVDDFKGDTTLAKYQYSVDGITGWHYGYVDGDIWRRDGTSINDAEPNDWSAPYKLNAVDGADGDTLYIEYRYSTDTLNWHYTFVDGDVWRQERIITNGFPSTEWTQAARIKGADGIDGDTVYIEYQYSVDGFEPWHTNFSTGDHYRRERLVTNGVAGEWSDSGKMVPEKEVDYYDGLNQSVVYLYIRSDEAPVLPTVNLTWNFTTKKFEEADKDGWSDVQPVGTEPPVWVTAATASSVTNLDPISFSEWAEPIQLTGVKGYAMTVKLICEEGFFFKNNTGTLKKIVAEVWVNGIKVTDFSKYTFNWLVKGQTVQVDAGFNYIGILPSSGIYPANGTGLNTNYIYIDPSDVLDGFNLDITCEVVENEE